ncbi:hypothetical protein [Mycolicibacterium komossense]|uniref:Uncharacterized protein n=1 Tax=Mycolicibacterium komossense TaxID=1779 RepID=A0ABT3CH99_9MYCO|nr:hypothetical protein [Mycolicibacterium komossense]MCV7228870.1 hypothetical protein [Mycolicibacterium komossense]
MLTAVAIIPSAPVLVPELAGAAAEVADLRAAVLRAAASLPQRWLAVGVGAPGVRVGPDAAGTFAGFGVDVPVALSPRSREATQLPLCALITGWVRGQVQPGAVAQVRCYAAGDPAATEAGRALRAELDAGLEPVGVLIVADGCHTLTPSAPGGYEPANVAVQDDLDNALGRGDVSALTALPAAVVGRAAFGVLAGLTATAPPSAAEFYRGAPYGVGYFAGVWLP